LIGKNEPLFEPIILPAGISMKFPIQLRVTIDLLQCPESMELGRFYLEWKRSKWTTITKTDDDQHSTKVDFNLPRLILIGPNSRQKSPIAIDFGVHYFFNDPFLICTT
jgi:hypothetical protein